MDCEGVRGTCAWQSSQPIESKAASNTGTHPSKPGVAGSSPAGRANVFKGLRGHWRDVAPQLQMIL